MSDDPVAHTSSPPELPPYLKTVCDLKPIVGTPTDDELVGIHVVVQVANKVVDVQGVGDSALLARLSEHLFNAQMGKRLSSATTPHILMVVARYRGKYTGTVFPENTTYIPPTLPAHVTVHLESITGVPSEEDVIKVQTAMRSYQQFSNIPSMFDTRINMELSQHLFDIQMARYTQRARQSHPNTVPHQALDSSTIERTADVIEGSNATGNNPGSGANVRLVRPEQSAQDAGIRDAMEKSNRLAEQANQLAERANLLIERSNQLMERSSEPAEQSNRLAERFNELFGRLIEHFERSDTLAEGLIKPMEKIGDVLGNINRVLVRIQHAIIRNCKGNTLESMDCLTNERGETPVIFHATTV
ncbi:hypothetical protein FRC11_014684, partial [Ceratobasidium sp. 423]